MPASACSGSCPHLTLSCLRTHPHTLGHAPLSHICTHSRTPAPHPRTPAPHPWARSTLITLPHPRATRGLASLLNFCALFTRLTHSQRTSSDAYVSRNQRYPPWRQFKHDAFYTTTATWMGSILECGMCHLWASTKTMAPQAFKSVCLAGRWWGCGAPSLHYQCGFVVGGHSLPPPFLFGDVFFCWLTGYFIPISRLSRRRVRGNATGDWCSQHWPGIDILAERLYLQRLVCCHHDSLAHSSLLGDTPWHAPMVQER